MVIAMSMTHSSPLFRLLIIVVMACSLSWTFLLFSFAWLFLMTIHFLALRLQLALELFLESPLCSGVPLPLPSGEVLPDLSDWETEEDESHWVVLRPDGVHLLADHSVAPSPALAQGSSSTAGPR